jgi:peroxiredoxin Q/BCP
MAQLCQDYQQFVNRDTEIVVVGPEDSKAFAAQWTKEGFLFVGLPDPKHTVADRYGQEVKLLRFGRMPAIIAIDKQGQVLETHYADNMRDYPANSDLLALLDEANAAVTP